MESAGEQGSPLRSWASERHLLIHAPDYLLDKVDELDQATNDGKLLNPKTLFDQLGDLHGLPVPVIQKVVLEQHNLA